MGVYLRGDRGLFNLELRFPTSRFGPVVGEKLTCKHDTREEAKLYDEFAVGLYRLSTSSSQEKEYRISPHEVLQS